jgi:hypothetical protein
MNAPNAKTPIVVALLVTALAVAGSAGRDGADARVPEAAAPVAAPAAPARPAAPAVVPLPAPSAPDAHQLQMPDGTSLPPLNGAIDPPKPRWQRGRPYSPVVGTVRLPDGRDAYQHADGTRTVTWMTFRKDLGRNVAVTAVSSPMPDATTIPDELPSGR